MSLTLSQIIEEAEARTPSGFSVAQKVSWLNEVNLEFFDLVKIPVIHRFYAQAGVEEYILPSSVRSKNIDRVIFGTTSYDSLQYNVVAPGRNGWTLDDDNQRLTLMPAPFSPGEAIIRYYRMPESTFLSSNLNVKPDAPAEYHWIYILGLSERMAKAMDDVVKANNIGSDYRANLTIAQQNFQRG